jgi:hypothetical protein
MTTIRHGVYITLVIAGLIFGIFISPLALQLLARQKLNWPLLSSIGQSYGAAAAAISALAFVGIGLSLILQRREARENRLYSIRELHSNLLRAGMADSRYLEVWGSAEAPADVDRDVSVYAQLVMNFIALLYEARIASLEEVRYHTQEIFDGALGRAYWEATRDTRLKFASGRSKKLVNVIDDEYRQAVEKGPPGRPLPRSSQTEPGEGLKQDRHWARYLRKRVIG